MTIPDALSRAPTTEATLNEEGFQDEVNAYVNVVIKNLPASQRRIQQIRKHQEEDAVLRQVSKYCYGGWPDTKIIPNEIKPYHSFCLIRTVGREGSSSARITNCYPSLSTGRYLSTGT